MTRHNTGFANATSAVSALAFGLSIASANAGVATMESEDGNFATFEYRDDMVRINTTEADDSWAVVRDGSLFTVSISDGQTIVIDAGSMMKGMAGMALPTGAVPSDLDGELISFEDTGANETVAGIQGDVWELVVEDSNGNRETATMVLSDDERAVEFSEAMFSMMSFATELTSEQAQEQGQDFRRRLEELDAGILRYGDDMKISKLTNEVVPLERFELPAEPMNLNGFGDMLRNMQQQQQSSSSSGQSSSQSQAQGQQGSGNLFSSMMGALGGNKEEASQEDAESGEKKENPIGRAFGSMFNRNKKEDDE